MVGPCARSVDAARSWAVVGFAIPDLYEFAAVDVEGGDIARSVGTVARSP